MRLPNNANGIAVGYARVSTTDQSNDGQLQLLRDAGCEKVFEEHASGAKTDRPHLAAALAYLRPGDTLVVIGLDRLGRSLPHLLQIMQTLNDREISLRSLREAIDTSTPTGRLTFAIFGAISEFERALIQERTHAGLAAARERGAKPGRKPSLSADQIVACRTLHKNGQHSIADLAAMFSTSRATIYRALSAA